MEKELIEQIQILNKLMVASLTKDMNMNEKIISLSKSGLKPNDIAKLLNITNNQVNVTLSKARKGRKV